MGTWNLTGTETFAQCTDSSYDHSQAETRVITWSAGGPGLMGTGALCNFDDTVSGNTASLASGSPSCTETFSNTGEVDQVTFESFTWVLSADGTTAQVSETAIDSATFADGSTTSCVVTVTDTASRQ